MASTDAQCQFTSHLNTTFDQVFLEAAADWIRDNENHILHVARIREQATSRAEALP
jgi:hypothetical protein